LECVPSSRVEEALYRLLVEFVPANYRPVACVSSWRSVSWRLAATG
jgi:hypothetical protein